MRSLFLGSKPHSATQREGGMDEFIAGRTGPATGDGRNRLELEVGSRRFAILELRRDSVLLDAAEHAGLRGFADIYDGERHLAQCLIVIAPPEGDRLRCSFKRRTTARDAPPADFAP